jgi:predicted transcriptional regulator
MQTLSIQEAEKKDTILGAISDKYSRIILEATMNVPKTALEISTEYNIPISTTYRRLQVLHDAKLLAISGSISDDGKKFFMYKSKVKQVSTSFQNGIIDVSIIPN